MKPPVAVTESISNPASGMASSHCFTTTASSVSVP